MKQDEGNPGEDGEALSPPFLFLLMSVFACVRRSLVGVGCYSGRERERRTKISYGAPWREREVKPHEVYQSVVGTVDAFRLGHVLARRACSNLRVTTLPPPPGFVDSSAVSINDSGQVIGAIYGSRNHGTPIQAALWQSGRVTQLNISSRWVESRGNAINNTGLATGMAFETGTRIEHAILWKGVGTAHSR
jgi:hypothetical protein